MEQVISPVKTTAETNKKLDSGFNGTPMTEEEVIALADKANPPVSKEEWEADILERIRKIEAGECTVYTREELRKKWGI